jgi:hypothetical protein
MIGENLKKAEEWFNRAVKMEEEGKTTMMDRCVTKMLALEKAGLANGESLV